MDQEVCYGGEWYSREEDAPHAALDYEVEQPPEVPAVLEHIKVLRFLILALGF